MSENSSANRVQYIACFSAFFSALCAGFLAYTAWKSSSYSELIIRPKLAFGTVVLHQYPSKNVLEITNFRNVGANDAQKCQIALFVRKNWYYGTTYKIDIGNLRKGEKEGAIFLRMPKTVKSTDGEITPKEYFEKNGLQLSVSYENTWSKEGYSETWDIGTWKIVNHEKNE